MASKGSRGSGEASIYDPGAQQGRLDQGSASFTLGKLWEFFSWKADVISSAAWKAIAWGKNSSVPQGRWVVLAATNGQGLVTSDDGNTWTFSNTGLPVAGLWNKLIYSSKNGLFVAVATNTGQALTSPNGINWTARTLPASQSWNGLADNPDGLIVAVSSTGTNRVATSPDGVTWTARSAAQANLWQSVTWGNGLFVAVSSDGANRVMTSPDGIAWTVRNASAAVTWSDVLFGGNKFVAIGSASNTAMWSLDGITWTSSATRGQGANTTYNRIAYGGGMFVAVGTGTTPASIVSSPDGQAWSHRPTYPAALGIVSDQTYNGVGYGEPGGRPTFIAVCATPGSALPNVWMKSA